MRRHLVRNLLFVVATVLLISVSLLAVSNIYARSEQPAILSGQTVPLLSQAHFLQATDPQQRISVAVALRLRNEPELDNLLRAIADPHSSLYRHYLTSEQFNQMFAPTDDQVQQITSFLRGAGLTVTSIAGDHLLVEASGSVGSVEQAFHVQLNNYRLGKHIFYANAGPPAVPAALSALISSVSGLDTSVEYHPLGLTRRLAGPTNGYGPQELSAAYDATPLHAAGLQGDNQTVAVFELDGYQQSDLNQYFQTYNLGQPVVKPILVSGATGAAGDGAIEVELDIEVIAALAPHATQLVYEGPNTTAGLNAVYNRIVSDDQAQVVSISWGLCEASTGQAELNTLDSIFKAGAAKGITFYAASGDSGAYDCNDTNLAVDSPADDPYVTGVGGTSLQLSNGAYGSETVWSNPSDTQRSPEGAGGGGGHSSYFSQPSWQSGPGTGVQNSGMREVPDVSADADPSTGYAVYCTVAAAGCSSSGGWITVGGTSAAAPLWAGSTALINQYLQGQGQSPVGHITPTLYSLFNGQPPFAPFHDITQGNNLFYQATSGYDMASGIGSPDVYNIARDLASSSGGGTPTPTPSATVTVVPTASASVTPAPSPTATTSLLQNGGFEQGSAPWQESSRGGYEIVDPSNPHSGSYSAYLCGYTTCNDQIWQAFSVPSSFSTITVTYWWQATTTRSASRCLDTFNAQLRSTTGAVIRTLQRSCNTSAGGPWVRESFTVTGDLAAYRGATVVLFFQGITAQGLLASSAFFVDDVQITLT